MTDVEGRSVRSLTIDVSYDDDQHPRHQRMEWISETRPTFLRVEEHAGWPKVELGNVVLTVSKHAVTGYGGPSAPLPRLGTATTAQLLKELEARLEDAYKHESLADIRRVHSRLDAKTLAYRTVDSDG